MADPGPLPTNMTDSAASGAPEPPPPDVLAPLGVALLAQADQLGQPLSIKTASDGRYVFVSSAWAKLFGRVPADVVGRSDAELLDPSLATALRTADQAALTQGRPLPTEHRFEVGGEKREYNVLRVVAADASGRPLLCCLWQDLAAARQREAQLKMALDQIEREQKAAQALRREMADHGLRDNASGLYTRAHFEDQLKRELDLSSREHREFALVHIALDSLPEKAVALGASAIDRIHEAMGRLLRGNTRAMDASCRFDDQAFCVLLSGVGLATAHSRMEGLRRQVATQLLVVEGQEFGFTVSMGVASFPHTAHTQDEVVGACQAALAEAARRGGNNVVLAAIRFQANARQLM